MVYITTREHDFSGSTLFWNRRKRQFQPYATKSCVYPTRKGAWAKACKLCRENIGMTMTLTELGEV